MESSFTRYNASKEFVNVHKVLFLESWNETKFTLSWCESDFLLVHLRNFIAKNLIGLALGFIKMSLSSFGSDSK